MDGRTFRSIQKTYKRIAAIPTVIATSEAKVTVPQPSIAVRRSRGIPALIEAIRRLHGGEPVFLGSESVMGGCGRPKFTKFDDGEPPERQDAAAGRKGEHDASTALKSFTARIEELKVDVFGNVAVTTFLFPYEAQMEKEKLAGKSRMTMVFAKQGADWKIVHEHGSPYKPTKP
jgi:hypothetical protein